MKTGTTDLPLHYGSAPRWLFEQITKLAREISLVLITEQGREEFLKKAVHKARLGHYEKVHALKRLISLL